MAIKDLKGYIIEAIHENGHLYLRGPRGRIHSTSIVELEEEASELRKRDKKYSQRQRIISYAQHRLNGLDSKPLVIDFSGRRW